MSRTPLLPCPHRNVHLWCIFFALLAMSGPLSAELKFRENIALLLLLFIIIIIIIIIVIMSITSLFIYQFFTFRFLDAPQTVTVTPNPAVVKLSQSITLDCTADGYPVPTFSWQLNGALVGGATQKTYALNNAKVEDAGNYSCLASNFRGEKKAFLVVNVECKYNGTAVYVHKTMIFNTVEPPYATTSC